MSKEEKNSKAYRDVVDCLEPQMPNDKEYMRFYRNWLALDPTRIDC